MDPNYENYFTQAELFDRGWTSDMIKRMNLKRDKVGGWIAPDDPTPTLLFLKRKVLDIEDTDRFKELLNKKAVNYAETELTEERIKELLDYADNVEIKVIFLPDYVSQRKAIDMYNYWHRLEGGDKITLYADRPFLRRIQRNYIRHSLTNYNEILTEIEGKVGQSDAYFLLKKRVEERIDEIWQIRKQEYAKKQKEIYEKEHPRRKLSKKDNRRRSLYCQ